RVVPDLKDDLSAVQTAFSKVVSGRSPEQRGNGLKFVSKAIKDKSWSLYFQSGNAAVKIDRDNKKYVNTEDIIVGCVAVVDYSLKGR
ncbi:MAG: hypothetical protein AABZ57_03090, partial [Candidatus Margulisiibacteriota bacterium]